MKKWFCGLLCIMMVMLVACDSDDSSSSGGSSKKGYELALEDYIDYRMGEANENTVKSLRPDTVWDYYEDEYDYGFDEFYEYYEEETEDRKADYKAEYGKDYKVTHKIEDKTRYDEDDLSDLAEDLNYGYDIDEDDVKQAYDLEVIMKIKGSKGEEESNLSLTAVKIGDDWYITSSFYY